MPWVRSECKKEKESSGCSSLTQTLPPLHYVNKDTKTHRGEVSHHSKLREISGLNFKPASNQLYTPIFLER